VKGGLPIAIGIGLVLVWVGYGVGYYGFDQIRGGNNGFLDLMIPGRFKAVPKDSRGTTGGNGQGAQASATNQGVTTVGNTAYPTNPTFN